MYDLRVTLNDIVVQHIVSCECLKKVLNYTAPMCDDQTIHLACNKQWGLVWFFVEYNCKAEKKIPRFLTIHRQNMAHLV